MNRRGFLTRVTMAAPVAALFAGGRARAAASLLQAGYAETDITPDIGMEQPGGYGKSFHQYLHDPCKVRASVFDDGAKRIALVGTDTLMIPRHLVLKVREVIERKSGIRGDAILIGASHSHSSGPVGMVQPGEFDHAATFVQELAYEKSSAADPKFLKYVEDQIISAVLQANGKRRPLACGAGSGYEKEAAFNRRFRMKNGRTQTHPRQGNPDIIRPAGPTDPEVGVIGTFDDDGNLIGCIVNYACHATTSPGGISANWIYYLEKTIRGVFGADVVVVFLAGANGDITQVDNLSPYVSPGREEWARLVGSRVGAEAVKVLASMHTGPMGPVDSAVEVLKIPRRVPSPENLKKAIELVKQGPGGGDPSEWTFAKETVMLDALIAKTPVVDTEVQAVQVGPAVFVTNPAEYFVEYGLDIKKRSKFPFTYPVELANGCVGYVPTEEALSDTGGGYETRLTSYSNLERTAGTQIADAGVRLANSLTPGEAPTRAPHAPFSGAGWSYGSVPAQLK
ncbi:MAG TPA: hypothetical protein VML01_01945 [Bryobacterales bacterium]|nr:hypothetical protein [Bryobacterales bacterium]